MASPFVGALDTEEELGGHAAAGPPPVRVHEVTKRFGTRLVLDALSLEVRAGEAVGLVGPNGAGKTTLMRLIVGLGRPNGGRVELFGAKPAKRSLARVGYMAQSEALYLDLSPRENLTLFSTLAGLDEPERGRRIDEALELSELQDRQHDRVEQLSGGMRRRVSLACAVVHRPELLLLDEPTVGVDPELRLSFWDHFMALKANGTSVLITTHHLDEAGRCDRLLLLKEGRIIAEGTPKALLQRAGSKTVEEAFLHFARHREAE